MTQAVMARWRRGAPTVVAALAAALVAGSTAGCAGSSLFPVSATMPATWDQAYAEVRSADPASVSLTEPTRLFLSGFDARAAKPRMPTRPTAPRQPRLAVDPFPLSQLRMPRRPPSSTACSTIAVAVGGSTARCGSATDEELAGDLPQGVPAESVIVGKAYSDGRMVLLERPGQGQAMWDAAMHERGHLLATWLCGQADCLDDKLEARGHADGRDYLNSLVEAFAQSWAQCRGAGPRPEYRTLPCTDVDAVVRQAEAEKAAAKESYEREQASYGQELAAYEAELKAYDRRSAELATLARFVPAARAASSATSSG